MNEENTNIEDNKEPEKISEVSKPSSVEVKEFKSEEGNSVEEVESREEVSELEVESEPEPVSFENMPQAFPINNNRIFVVHTRNDLMKEQVVAVLKEFQLTPIFTQSPMNVKKPMAQKVTEFSGVTSAIFLLTGDDFVYGKEEKPHNAFLKVKQNIVFELGYWVAKLGRPNVVAVYLKQKTFRPPTEYFDAIYIPYDKKSPWKPELISRLKDMGYGEK